MFDSLDPKLAYFLCALLGYLLGCFNTAYVLGRLHGRDIRKAGSHNAGASNAVIVFGYKVGFIVVLCDILKAIVSYGAAKKLLPELELSGILAATMSMIGHAYPFWMGFRGGKGFASFLGLIWAVSGPLMFVIAFLWTAAVTLIADRIVYGTLSVFILYPVYLYRTGAGGAAVAIVSAGAVLMIFKHRINIVRIIRGEELGFRQMRRRMASGEKAKDDM